MRLTLMSLALVFLWGCSQNTAGISINSSNQHVVLSDATLAQKLKLGNAKTQKVNERLLADVKLTNTTNETQHIQYRFYWYDKLGLELSVNEAPWKTLTLYGGDSASLQGVALDSEAENFRVSIREMK